MTKAGTHDTYTLGSILLLISALMGIAFGIGIVLHYQYKYSKLIFLGGLILIIIIGIANSLTGTIFPQDTIGGESTFPGTMHVILVGINIILIFPAILLIGMGLDRERQWKWFRLYSFISVLIILIFGGLSAYVIMNGIELMGLFERIVVYTIQIWTVVLAYIFLSHYKEREQ